MDTKLDTKQFDLYLNGALVAAKDGCYFESINPSDGSVVAQLADASVEDMKAAIASAREAFDNGEWSSLSFKERGKYLLMIASLIREHAKELADLECRDTGKIIKHTTFIDVPSAADAFEHFGKYSSDIKGDVVPVELPVKSLVEYEPRGVIGCIIPWNYPLLFLAWKVAPALLTGNTVVLKPSPLACASIMRVAELLQKEGFPKGVLNIITSSSNETAQTLVESPDVNMISFTGSTETASKILEGSAKHIKKTTFELGGKSANIVFADCDQEAALGTSLTAIFMNQGQMCTAGSRLLIEDKIYDEFLAKLLAKARTIKIGPAIENGTQFGPLISEEHRNKILKFIEKGKEEGATLVWGGKIPEGEEFQNGAYLEPTIFTDVDNKMEIAQEEAFGPVLCVMKFSNEDEAIKIANDSKYGLAACIWTKDLDRANKVSKQLQAGIVWINTYGMFPMDVPFGGYKQSGFGRELGKDGLLEYMQSKHICTDQTPGGRPLVASWF